MPVGDRFASIRETIQHEMRVHAIPSVAVAVARGRDILWEEAFGWADREARLPATPHTMYSLASISKPITATGLMVLAERGAIDLDRPINDYLGAGRVTARVGDAAAATVRRVADHSSGLPLHYQFFYADEPFQRPPMAETIRRYANLVTAPGERPLYSNLGYGILDHVIERVSGKPYADFMREEVFLPLGMTRSSIDVGPGPEPFAAHRRRPRTGEAGPRLPRQEFHAGMLDAHLEVRHPHHHRRPAGPPLIAPPGARSRTGECPSCHPPSARSTQPGTTGRSCRVGRPRKSSNLDD